MKLVPYLLAGIVAAAAVAACTSGGGSTPAQPAGTYSMPADRATAWNPEIPGGIPARGTVCASLEASTYGDGARDATAPIQAALDSCPEEQVVSLSAGTFAISATLVIARGNVLRGKGPKDTLLRSNGFGGPIVSIGRPFPHVLASIDLAADGAKGATSIAVADASGFQPGSLALIDELWDPAYVQWSATRSPPGDPSRGWFSRSDRPVGQMVEVRSVSGNTVLTLAAYSWVKNVESEWSTGDSITVAGSFRSVVRDSYFHHSPQLYPGGGAYGLSLSNSSADNLVENNVFWRFNKVMVMRASGGGNVVGYNYFDDGFIGSTPLDYTQWMEVGMSASHMTCPHYELFEGNEAFNIDADNTWGNSVYVTFFRNHATGKRRSFPDVDNRRAIGLMAGSWWYTFVGNVLGYPAMSPAPHRSFRYESSGPWGPPVPMWQLGYDPENWKKPADPRVLSTTIREGNYDYVTGEVHWSSEPHQLPDSLYLTGKPAFFGEARWPWVDPFGATKLHQLPARSRF